MQRLCSRILVPTLALALTGCEALNKLRPGRTEAPATAPATPPAGKAGLEVLVEPPRGISIWIDGDRVATQAPYRAVTLEPGGHSIFVRGMGYLPVTLPVDLKEREVVRIPVSLRPRPQVEEPEPPPPPPPPSFSEGPRRIVPRPPETPIELPADVPPIELHIVPQPTAPVVLDGARVDGRAVRIHRQRGLLQVGALSLAYAVGKERVLEFMVPDDDASYNKDGTDLGRGALVRLNHGVTRLRRGTSDGKEQSAIVRRAD